ncbi:IPT/TIG domain-containing protein [Candidatus Ozemobacteraceae bacterium]|nr:IPT/TIG domain-containing protein [Candidatus Ozemobacteraceae bacterium]
MKYAVCLCSILLLVVALGCGGGGSGNPIAITTTPQIYQVTPSTGFPGDLVSIRGVNFGNPGTYSSVTYNGVACQYTSWTDSLIYCYVPQNAAGNAPFIVTSAAGVSSTPYSQFTLTSAQISSVSPSSGIPGSFVYISGIGFGVSSSSSRITFNGIAATDVAWTPTYITCKVPYISQSGSVPLSVYIGSGNNPVYTFSYILPQVNVAVAEQNSTGHYIGAELAVSGQGFGSTPGEYNGMLTFGTTRVYPTWYPNKLVFTIPAGVGIAGDAAYPVTLTLNDRSYTAGNWYVGKPDISDASPGTVYSENANITLSGQYLGLGETGSYIMCGGTRIQPSSAVLWSDTSITFKNPFNAAWGDQDKSTYVVIGGLQSNVVTIQVE